MAIQLTKDNTATPAVYSTGTGTDPVTVELTLDGTSTPTSITGTPLASTFVWANDGTTNIDNYSNIVISIVGSNTGITWELSLDGATGWGPTISIPNMDVSVTHAATQIYARASAINDGSVLTANYTTADVKIAAVENPA